MHIKKLIMASALALSACSSVDDTQTPSSSAAASDTTAACAALNQRSIDATAIALPTRGAVVDSARLIAASPSNENGEYCLLTGRIVSVDMGAQPIGFSLALPTAWNRRAVQLGGGGWDGVATDPTATADPSEAPPAPLAKGYAVFGDDGGHLGTDASFTMNDEQLRNYGGNHVKKTHDVAVALIRSRYGALPAKMYFAGQSNGGHEAMVALQRWGGDYDGILAVFPALAWTPNFLKMQQIGVAMRASGGAGWISKAKADAVRAAYLQACDAADGLIDGIVSNMAACKFEVSSLRCPGGADTGDSCLSDPQLAVFTAIQTPLELPYALANGITRAPAFNNGADWSGAIGPGLPLGDTASFPVPSGGGSPALTAIGWDHWFADGFVRFALLKDPNADTLAFDPLAPGDNLPRLQQLSGILDATNPNIQAFLNRGGKLILLHGQSDQLIATQPTVDYVQSLVAEFGQAAVDEAVRFYLVPGYSHFGGLSFNATQGLALFPALERWVDESISPGTLTATDVNPAAAGRTRPLCRYPTWPKYNGTGDSTSAASFVCVNE